MSANSNDHRPELAAFAEHDSASRGRRHARSERGEDSPFELDRHRIMSCTAFRRLGQKTQVVVTSAEGDHYRTRLTHTLEVTAHSERLARLLGLNPRLAGSIALAHDLGHSPFGHAGEKTLNELMADHGGFEHNLQSLRVVDYLEHPYPGFRGLNLTFEVREALIKHRTRYDRPTESGLPGMDVSELLASGPNCSLEGQVANVGDAVAYSLHDIEDGLFYGLLDEQTLEEAELWRTAAGAVRKHYHDAPIHAVRRPILDTLSAMIAEDAYAESSKRIKAAKVTSREDARGREDDLVGFSPAFDEKLAALQKMLFESVYRHQRVVRMDAKAQRLIRELFEAYLDDTKLLPARFRDRIPDFGRHRVVCDYIAGMTDRFCSGEHQKIFSSTRFE